MEADDKKGWNPYLCGALAGVLSVLSVWVVGKYFGASTSFVRSTGMIERVFDPERIQRMPYFIKQVPEIDWQWMFVAGILLGSLIASITTGTFRWKGVPEMWERRFGQGRLKRGATAFLGGLIAMFGARLADG